MRCCWSSDDYGTGDDDWHRTYSSSAAHAQGVEISQFGTVTQPSVRRAMIMPHGTGEVDPTQHGPMPKLPPKEATKNAGSAVNPITVSAMPRTSPQPSKYDYSRYDALELEPTKYLHNLPLQSPPTIVDRPTQPPVHDSYKYTHNYPAGSMYNPVEPTKYLHSMPYSANVPVDTPPRQPQPQEPHKYDYQVQYQQPPSPPTGYPGNVKEPVKYSNANMSVRPSTPPAPTEIPVAGLSLQPEPPRDPYKFDYHVQSQHAPLPPMGYPGYVREPVKYSNAQSSARTSSPPAPKEIPPNYDSPVPMKEPSKYMDSGADLGAGEMDTRPVRQVSLSPHKSPSWISFNDTHDSGRPPVPAKEPTKYDAPSVSARVSVEPTVSQPMKEPAKYDASHAVGSAPRFPQPPDRVYGSGSQVAPSYGVSTNRYPAPPQMQQPPTVIHHDRPSKEDSAL